MAPIAPATAIAAADANTAPQACPPPTTASAAIPTANPPCRATIVTADAMPARSGGVAKRTALTRPALIGSPAMAMTWVPTRSSGAAPCRARTSAAEV